MNNMELGRFAARVRVLFGGAIDEPLFAIALREISSHDAGRAFAALDSYAARYGGGKMRFFSGKFFEFLDAVPKHEPDAVLARAAAFDAENGARAAIETEWETLRQRVEAIPLDRRRATMDTVRRRYAYLGEPSGDTLSRSWLVAILDTASAVR